MNFQKEYRAYIDYLLQYDEKAQPYFESGFPSLDRLAGSMLPGEIILIAGRPGMGKMAFMMQMISH